MLLTYQFFFFDISSLLYEQPSNIIVSIPHSHNEWSVLLNIEKKNSGKSTAIYKALFSSVMTNLWIKG